MLNPRLTLVASFCLSIATLIPTVASAQEADAPPLVQSAVAGVAATDAVIPATDVIDATAAGSAAATAAEAAASDVAARPVVPVVDDEGNEIPDPSRIAIPLNAKVRQYLDSFTTNRKRFLEDGLARGARYLPMIQAIFRAEGLPEDLVYLPLIESAFRTQAVSRAGATGIWQFMKGTATFNGLSRDWYVDERSDPEKSTRAAARLLKTLYGMFGDWHLVLAAYNAGAGRVQQAMKRSQYDSYWALTASTRYLPSETREYVPLFLASVLVARNPLAYGLNVPTLEQPLWDIVSLTGPLDLRRVAEWAGTTVEAIQSLNPELRRWTTPVRAVEYLLKVPVGTGDLVQARLAAGVPGDLRRYVVKKGDTLSGIARKLQVTRADLAEANYLPVTATIRVGDSLIVPRASQALAALPDMPLLALAPAASVPVGTSGTSSERAVSRVVHVVRDGETVDGVAEFYGTSPEFLREWNGMTGDGLLPGQELTIFTAVQ